MPNLVLEPFVRSYHDAATFSLRAHRGQSDQGGRPYWHHPLRVSERAADLAIANDIPHLMCQQIALLHDVIEDTPYDADHLRREGFSEYVVSGVVWLTRSKDEPYAAYISRLCAEAPLPVLIVKLADLNDNLDPDRVARLPEPQRTTLPKRYEAARAKIADAIQERKEK